MRLVIDISEYNKQWIDASYGIPDEINPIIAKAIIDGEEQSEARWIYQLRDSENGEYRCSACGNPSGYPTKYCDECGAKMEEMNEDTN